MKNLTTFINEKFSKSTNAINESDESKEIRFNFTDLENAKETIESLEKMDNVTKKSDNEIVVTVTSDNADKLDTVVDILQQYAETLRHSSKRSSSETYAQKTIKFQKSVEELNDTIDELTSGDSEEKEDE